MYTILLSDDALRRATVDAVIRYREHDQYGSHERARTALRQRAPGHSVEVYDDVFAFYLDLLSQTVEVVTSSALCAHVPTEENREEGERLENEVRSRLASAYPDIADTALLGEFVGWVHYWHCLK